MARNKIQIMVEILQTLLNNSNGLFKSRITAKVNLCERVAKDQLNYLLDNNYIYYAKVNRKVRRAVPVDKRKALYNKYYITDEGVKKLYFLRNGE